MVASVGGEASFFGFLPVSIGAKLR